MRLDWVKNVNYNNATGLKKMNSVYIYFSTTIQEYHICSIFSTIYMKGVEKNMSKDWTGNLVGLMHTYRISQRELAEELGLTNRYVCMVLNRHRSPPGVQERFEAAAHNLIERKTR